MAHPPRAQRDGAEGVAMTAADGAWGSDGIALR